MSIYKEHILPAINNCRASPNFVEHLEGNNLNYTQNNIKTQAQIVTAFSFTISKSIVIYVLDNDDKRVAIYSCNLLERKKRKSKSTQIWPYSKQTSIRY